LGEPLVAYAVKANGNVSVLRTLARLGAGADTVSEGEIRRALKAGVPGERIIFSGVAKTAGELAFALDAGVHQINVESAPELERLARWLSSAECGLPSPSRQSGGARGGHDKIATGKADSKFGVPLGQVPALYAQAAGTASLEALGLACHIGSQITDLRRWRKPSASCATWWSGCVARACASIASTSAAGSAPPTSTSPSRRGLRRLRNGGAGVRRPSGRARLRAGPHDRGQRRRAADPGGACERPPGRPALPGAGRGMNDLLRPAMYDAYHDLRPVRPAPGETAPHDVVGPVCESSDVFAVERSLAPMQAGDLAVFMTAGAYGAAMASEYNTRPLVPEVLVRGGDFAVVRARETYEQILAREAPAPWL
jgi:diaminopimelate decarboxylase